MILILFLILFLLLLYFIFYLVNNSFKEYTVFDKLNFDVNSIFKKLGIKRSIEIFESNKLSYWEKNRIYIVRKNGLHHYDYNSLVYAALLQASKMLAVNNTEKSWLKLLKSTAKDLGIQYHEIEDYLTI